MVDTRLAEDLERVARALARDAARSLAAAGGTLLGALALIGAAAWNWGLLP